MAAILLFALFFQGIMSTSAYFNNSARMVDDRIKLQKHPYQLSLNYRKLGHYCGGAVIRSNAALTVAYCLVEKEIKEIYFRCGVTDRSSKTNLGSYGKKAFIHEKFDGITNIVALAWVEKKFPIDGINVATVSISTGPVRAGNTVTIAGWNTFEAETDEATHTIHQFDVDVVGHLKCAAKFGEFQKGIVAPGTMCAGPGQDGRGYCFGYTGSPVLNEDGQLVGAVSWHEDKCFNSDLPGIFCDYYHYKDWIDDLLKKSGRRSKAPRALVFVSLPFILAWATWLLS